MVKCPKTSFTTIICTFDVHSCITQWNDTAQLSQSNTPLVAGEVIVDAGLHVLEGIECGKHVDESGQSQQIGLRDEVLPLLWVSQRPHLLTEPRGGAEHESHQLLGLVDFRAQNGDCFLVYFHPIGLLMGLDLEREGEEIGRTQRKRGRGRR